MIRFIILAGWLVLASQAFAQEEDQDTLAIPAPRPKDSLRSYYIKSFPDQFFIWPVIKQRSLSFDLAKVNDKSRQLSFKPNNSYSFGVGMYLLEFGFELAFAIPVEEKTKAIYGESDARDIQLNVLGKKWGGDAFYQKYSGFYLLEKGNEPMLGMPYPQRPDITSRNFGVTANYVFNNQKFSFRSAYNFAEQQLYSKGSFLIFSTVNSFKLSADSSILNSSHEQVFGDQVSFTQLRYTTFSAAPGYTHSFVFRNFFLNATLSIGPAHHWIYYKLENGAARNEIAINSYVVARIALGYNGDRFFGGISFITQGNNVKFEDVSFSNRNGTFKMLVGYRFKEFGFLKKTVWDLIPIKF